MRETLREEFNQMVFEGIENDALPQGGGIISDFFVRRAVRVTDRRIFVPGNVRDQVVYSNAIIRLLSRGEKVISTMSEPQLIAFMLQTLGLTGTQRVLEIGTGTGYQAAILAQLASEVHSLEIIPDLAKKAEKNLKRAGIDNTQVHLADGALGWPQAAPYNAIILAASVPEIPQALIDQTAEGGRILAPVKKNSTEDELVLGIKYGESLMQRAIIPVSFVPMESLYLKPKETDLPEGLDAEKFPLLGMMLMYRNHADPATRPSLKEVFDLGMRLKLRENLDH